MHLKSLLLLLLGCAALPAADWTQFRGGSCNGVAGEDSVPSAIDADKCLAWKANLPGEGLSSPIIVGDRVFVTCSSGLKQQALYVICFRASDGAKLWERKFWATGRTMVHEKIAVAAPTPASDGKHIVAIFSSNDIVCLDLEGNLIWFRGLGRDYPNASNSLGMASSLLIAGGVVVTQVESQSDGFTVGLDLATGRNCWKLVRPRKPNWTSPVLWKSNERELVALHSAEGVVAIEPATGKKLWEYAEKTSSVPSCAPNGNVLFVPSQGITALQPGAGVEPPTQLWRSAQLRAGTPSPAVLGNRLFLLSDGGILTCADAANGTRLWQLRLEGEFSSTPVAAGNFLYCVNEKGLAQVVDTTKPEGEIVSKLDLGEKTLATPSIAGGAIYFRSNTRVWKIGKS